MLEIIRSELGEKHSYKSKLTEKYYPGTPSDYYSVRIDVCGCRIFLKLLIANRGTEKERLVVTYFKKDNRQDS